MVNRTLLGASLTALSLLFSPGAGAQYLVNQLFNTNGIVPGTSNITWAVNGGQIPSLPLSIEGSYVAFVQCYGGCGPDYPTNGVWVENIATQTFTHLISPGDAAPVTNGAKFASIGGYAVVSGGNVYFLTLDAATNGIYAVPETGGAVKTIANLNSALPSFAGTPMFQLGNSEQYLMHADGKHIAFHARNSNGAVWTYLANLDGSGITEIGGPNVEVGLPGNCQPPVVSYDPARVWGANAVVAGSTNNGIGPYLYVTPLTGFPAGPACSPGGYLAYAPILQYNTPLPGEPPSVQLTYVTYYTADNSHVYVTASGGNPGSYGLYQLNFDGSGLTAIVNTTKPLPGLYPPYSASGGTTGIAAENGTALFSFSGFAADGTDSAGGLYAYQNGAIARIAGTGDVLGGITGNSWNPPAGLNSINGGRVVFSFGNPGAIGYFIAAPGQTAVYNGASYAAGTAAPNTILSIFGPALACSGPPQVTVGGAAATVLYAGATQINFVAPPVPGTGAQSVQVTCNGVAAQTATVAASAVSPAIFTLTGSGSGQGAIVNQDGAINGAANAATRGGYVSVYATGFGPFNAASADGLQRLTYPVTATVGGMAATVIYAGEAPGETPGLQEINLQIPANAPTGAAVAIALTVNGEGTAAGVTVAVQ